MIWSVANFLCQGERSELVEMKRLIFSVCLSVCLHTDQSIHQSIDWSINWSISQIYASVVVGVVVMFKWIYLAEMCTLTSAF